MSGLGVAQLVCHCALLVGGVVFLVAGDGALLRSGGLVMSLAGVVGLAVLMRPELVTFRAGQRR